MTATVDSSFEAELDAAAALMQHDNAAACRQLHALLDDAKRRDATGDVADAAYLFARGHLLQGDLDAALELIELAKVSWLAIGETAKASRTDLGRMNVLDDLGRHTEAIAVGTALLERLGESDDPHITWIKAAASKNLGISHGYLGRHHEALLAYSQAEQLYQAMGGHDDQALVTANRGVELLELGDAAAAVAALREAAVSLDAQGDRLFVAKCLAYEAQAQLVLGNYLACSAATDGGAQLLEHQQTNVEYARIQLVRANTLRSLNQLDESVALYRKLTTLFADEDLAHDHAVAQLGLARALARRGDQDDSRQAFERAVTLYEAVGDHGQAAVADVGLSELLDDELARPLAEHALDRLRTTRRPAELVAALLRCAQLEPDDRTALSLLDEVALIVHEHNLAELVWRQQHERARRHRSLGDFDASLEALALARSSIDAMRATIDRDLERIPFMRGRDVVHTDSISLLLDLGRTRDAYEIVQHERSRTLVEVMRGELERVHTVAVETELDSLYSALLCATSAGSAASQMTRVNELEAQSPTGSIRAQSMGHAEVALGTVVTYQVLGDEVLAFVDTAGVTRVVRHLGTTDQLHLLQSRLEAQWRRFEDPGLAARHQTNLLATTTVVLQQLYVTLVAPLDVIDAPSLVIVPPGTMANIPFSALHDGTCHLVERMPITIAPSAYVAAQARQRSAVGPQCRRLIVGVESAETPNVAREVALLGDHPRTTVLTGTDATVEAFQRECNQNEILHIASHGIHRPDNPIFSGVQFADRWLTAGEMAGMQFDGQLVILSACSTGRQAGLTSVCEFDGLPRALLAAGAGSVAVNLWPVDDAATSMLMGAFHEHLSTQTVAQALRSAQRAAMTQTPHPYYWASTVIVGAADQIEDQL